MENIALIDSFSEFKDDKFIDRVTLMAILEDVFRNALKKKYGSDDNFDIIINPDKGDMEIWQRRIVVADDDLDLEHLEITLSEARKIEPDFEIGEDLSEKVKLEDFGRRAVLSVRQNLVQKMRLSLPLHPNQKNQSAKPLKRQKPHSQLFTIKTVRL